MEHHGTIVKVIGDAISSKSRSTPYRAPKKKKKVQPTQAEHCSGYKSVSNPPLSLLGRRDVRVFVRVQESESPLTVLPKYH
jgi:hypothetical protein